MAVKIERGGWLLIFLIGLALVGYSLNRYGVLNIGSWFGSHGGSTAAKGGHLEAASPAHGEHHAGERGPSSRQHLGRMRGRVGGEWRAGYGPRLHL